MQTVTSQLYFAISVLLTKLGLQLSKTASKIAKYNILIQSRPFLHEVMKNIVLES